MSWCNIFMLHQFCPKSLRRRGEDGSDVWSTGSSEGERSFASLWSRNDALSPSCNAHTHNASTRPEQLRRTSDWCFHGIFLWMEFDQVGDIFHGCSLDLLRESHQDVQCCAPEDLRSANLQPLEVSSSLQNVKIRLISVKRPKRRELRSETAANSCPGPNGQKRRCSCGRQRRFLPISRFFSRFKNFQLLSFQISKAFFHLQVWTLRSVDTWCLLAMAGIWTGVKEGKR